MSTFGSSALSRRPGRPILSFVSHAGRRSVALGALLLLGSTIGAMATANTPPTLTNVNLSTSVIDEGGEVILTGTFTDPDPNDSHTVQIEWHEPNADQQKIDLLPGQFSFQTTKKFTDDKYPYPIRVAVIDHQPSEDPNDNAGGAAYDLEYLPFEVKNVAPSFAKGIEVKKPSGLPGKVTIEGNVADPGSDVLEVTAQWGTSSQFPSGVQVPCTMSKRHFVCEHAYPLGAAGNHNVTLRVRDDDGGQQSQLVKVQIP